MNGTLEYIESYFKEELSSDERKRFEERCATDMAFAGDVAFFISSKQALRNELLSQKQSQWREEGKLVQQIVPETPVRKINNQSWMRYAAAACVIAIATLYFLFKPTSPQKFALNYFNEHYSQLSQTMSGESDTLELGKAAYNNKEYDKAAALFDTLVKNHPDNADAKQYLGLVYLRQSKYDQAIQTFDALAAMPGLYSNPGLFLKALALMTRNQEADKLEVKRILEEVVAKNLANSKEAAAMLKHF